MLQAGFAREIITPARGVGLDGYFNARPNTGVLDDISVKAALFRDGDTIGGIVTFELEALTEEFYRTLETRLRQDGCEYASNLIYHAIHSHTAPGCGLDPQTPYFHSLLERACACIRNAVANLREARLEYASQQGNPFAFNRRYFMKNGGVKTNPGKLNPDIVKPEGPVDDTIAVLAVTDVADHRLMGVLANLCNHSDTIGGTLVSADWPGRLERCVQNELGEDIPVVTMVSPAGDINHFDVNSSDPQDSYAEAKRLGRGYGEIVFRLLRQTRPLAEATPLRIASTVIALQKKTISAAELADARKTAAELAGTDLTHDITSEDLITNSPAIRLTVARKIIDFAEKESGRTIPATVRVLKFGSALALVGLPGEPFTEIGLEIKKQSSFPITLLMGLSMGVVTYLPLRECYARGGYEPGLLCCSVVPGMAEKLIAEVVPLLRN